TVGASGGQLARQYYVETALTVLGSILLAFFIFWICLGAFNRIADKSFSILDVLKPEFGLILLAIWALITAISGSYPALYLSSFRPIQIFRQSSGQKAGGAVAIRKGLVVFQFCISSALMVSAFIFYQQLNFIQKKELGFNAEQVMAVRVGGIRPFSNVKALESELNQLANIQQTALSQTYPGHGASGYTISRPGAAEDEAADLSTCRAYPNVFDVLDIELLAGRTLRERQEGDTIVELILNESAVEFLGLTPEEALGRQVDMGMRNNRVVGVTKDFHYGPLRQKIGNFAFHNRPSEWLQYLLIRLDTDDIRGGLKDIQQVFKKTVPNTAFEFVFLDAQLENLYRSEKRLGTLVIIFAGLAIFIACLGLFALSAFATERRTKEIGVRKVLGASNQHIIGLLTKDFLRLVGIAFLLGAPLAWWAMNQWLQGFAYRTTIQWWVFPLTGILVVLIAFLTISYQSFRVTKANPVKALKID
ncbi:MAG: FtsX-like permease family protein, partial [Bacteroidota bacterium]